MARVGKLNVELGAGNAGLKRDLGKAERLIKDFKLGIDKKSKSWNPLGGVIGKPGGFSVISSGLGVVAKGMAATGVAAVGVGTALGVVAQSQIDLIGDQADAARKLGVTRNELVTLQRAAKSVGIENEQVTGSFEKMSDVLGSAFRGNTSARAAIEGIGLSIEKLQRMNPAQRFMAIGQAIDRIDDPAAKISAARDIFGKQGGAMTNLFEGGAAAIADAATELRTFGSLLSGVSQHAIERAGDAFDTFGAIIDGLKTKLADEVSPVIVKIGKDTTAWIESMGGINAIADQGLTKLTAGIGSASSAMNSAVAAKRTAGSVVGAVTDPVSNVLEKIPGSKTLGKVLSWNPVRDTIGAVYGKHKSDLDLEAMQDKASRRMGGKSKTVMGAVGQYLTDAKSENAADYAKETGIVQATAAEAPAMRPTMLKDWKLKHKGFGGPAYEDHKINPDPMTKKYQAKVPSSTRDYSEKIPSEAPKWESKIGASMEVALKGSTSGRSGGGSKVEALLQANNDLLTQINRSLKGGVVGGLV